MVDRKIRVASMLRALHPSPTFRRGDWLLTFIHEMT
jgi:hypothetical protein